MTIVNPEKFCKACTIFYHWFSTSYEPNSCLHVLCNHDDEPNPSQEVIDLVTKELYKTLSGHDW